MKRMTKWSAVTLTALALATFSTAGPVSAGTGGGNILARYKRVAEHPRGR